MPKTIHELTNELTGFKLIKKRFEELNIGNEEFGNLEIPEKDKILGPWKEIQIDSSDPDDYPVVVYFKKHDVYIKIDGYYTSYEGSTFDEDYYEAKPEQKTITVYTKYKPKKQK